MPRHLFRWCWLHIICLLITFVSESQMMITTHVDVPLTSETDCDLKLVVGYSIQAFNRYDFRVNLDRRGLPCPPDKRGFQCGAVLGLDDPFEALGGKICVDLQGVASTISHNQFAIILSDQSEGELQRVYSKSTRFDRPPNNIVCSEQTASTVQILLRAISTVEMCPDILPTLENHNTSLGTVFVKQEIPTHTLSIQTCDIDSLQGFEGHFILKVLPGGAYTPSCKISLRPRIQYRHTETCMFVKYISTDFRCSVRISVESRMNELVRFDIPSQGNWNPSGQNVFCFKFSTSDPPHPRDTDFPVLKIRSDIWQCRGKFALEINYTDDSYDNGDHSGPKSSINRRNLYMAVFISVISVCIFILGLTCLCCLRMRARSRQNSHRSSSRGLSANTGVDNNAMAGGAPALWTSTSSDQIFGLPSYEEATNGLDRSQSLGSVLSSPEQVEKPPAYESLYTSETSLPSTSMLPPDQPQEISPQSLPEPSAPDG